MVPGGLSTGLLRAEANWIRHLDFDGPGRAGCLGLGTAGCDRAGRDLPDDRFPVQQLPLFRPRELRPVYALPRRNALGFVDGRAYQGRSQGRLKDLELLAEIGDSIGIMPGTTICGLADGAAWPIKTAILKFRDELEDYVKADESGTGCLTTIVRQSPCPSRRPLH